MIFRFILFLCLFYLLYYIVKSVFLKPFQEGFKRQDGRGESGAAPNSREGDVSISYNPEQKNQRDDKTGEYIDYEEVKE